jgi:hypothetical protein
MIDLTLPEGSTPTIQPYDRFTGLAVGSPISGTVVSGRPTLFRFDVSGLVNSDYVMDLASPAGRFLVRKTSTDELIADEWWQLDLPVNLATPRSFP